MADVGISVAQHYPIDLSAMMEVLYVCAGHAVASSHLLLLKTWNVAVTTEKLKFFLKIYLFIFIYDRHREREKEAETQEEGEAGSMPGARRGTRSRDSRVTPWAKGRRQTAEPPRDPL